MTGDLQVNPLANEPVEIDYTNYRGERAVRLIRPHRLWFGATEHHPAAQYLLDAYDLGKHAMRTFALADIHHWKPV